MKTVWALRVFSDFECWDESLHETKAGAWRAGRRWLYSRFMERYEWLYVVEKSRYTFQPCESFRVLERVVEK